MGDNKWDGLHGKMMHQLHCRPDRCAYGCDCPHHDGVNMRLTFAERIQAWRNRRQYRRNQRRGRHGRGNG